VTSARLFPQFLFGILSITVLASCTLAGQPDTVPALREWQQKDDSLILAPKLQIVTVTNAEDSAGDLRELAQLFANDVQHITGISATPGDVTERGDGVVYLHLGETAKKVGDEGYVLDIQDDVHIRSSSLQGLFYGTQTVLQLLQRSGDGWALPNGHAVDYPLVQNRGIMIDAGRRFYEVEFVEELIRNLAWLKMNTLHMHFTEWSGFRLQSDVYPGLAADRAYSKADIRHLQDVAKRYHVDLVPEIDLPAHATAMTDYDPELGFTCPSMRAGHKGGAHDKAWTIDITRERNREWINKLLHEFVPLFDSQYFHLGGDEYPYDPAKYECPELLAAMKERGLAKPGDVFVEWLNETNDLIKSYGKTTQIWNWWRFLDNDTSIQPAKDIVVNVWNLPRQQQIIEDGYQVIITSESDFYVSPGLENDEGYGIFDLKYMYENYSLDGGDSILGYKLSVWSDEAEHHTDHWFRGKYYEPKAVIAEKTWGAVGSEDVEAFLARLNRVGAAPPVYYPR
jgi:hexosaminidase